MSSGHTAALATRHWWPIVAGLVALRLWIPLAALLGSGEQIPGLPRYDYEPLNGDAVGFFEAVKAVFLAASRPPQALLGLGLVLTAAAAVAAVALWRTRAALRWVWILLPAIPFSLTVARVLVDVEPPGAAVIGWPLAWALPLVPVWAAGGNIEAGTAFAAGFPLGLAAIAATVVATAYAGLYATGRRSVGLVAAALYACWPLLTRPLAGPGAWENGQWNVDVGLHLYTEPLSTCLVAVALALLLRQASGPVAFAVAGLLLGYATVVKLSDVLVAGVLVGVVALCRGARASVPVVAGGIVAAPLVAAYWSKGYVAMFDGRTAAVDRPWALDYARPNWEHSLLFTPTVLVLLAPLAVFGVLALRGRYARLAVVLPIVATALLYSFYYVTYQHPRFLYVALPPLFVLEAAGCSLVVERLRELRRGPAPVGPSG